MERVSYSLSLSMNSLSLSSMKSSAETRERSLARKGCGALFCGDLCDWAARDRRRVTMGDDGPCSGDGS